MFEMVGYAILWIPRKVFGGALASPGQEVYGNAYIRKGGMADFVAGIITCAMLIIGGLILDR